MRSFIPKLSFIPPSGTGLRAKFGGVPWGLPPEAWPVCHECGDPMSSLAQVPVRGHLDRVDWFGHLDVQDRVLHLFTCEREETSCSMFDASSGANAAFFVAERDLLSWESVPPSPKPPRLPEVWIRGWAPHDDSIPDDKAGHFDSPNSFRALAEVLRFPHEFKAEQRTKIGGVPYWTGNGPQQHPGAPYRYLLQIDIYLMVPEADRGMVEIGNFCGTGTGYLFVDVSRADLPSLFAINR